MTKHNLAVLILAAGNSSRLGQPKQLLSYKDTTLLEHTIRCGKTVSDNVFVVLGGNEDLIKNKISLKTVTSITNPYWKKGIGSSISYGTRSIIKTIYDLESLLILLSDQPKITGSVLSQLITAYTIEHKTIIASNYGKSYGVPAIFEKTHFPELMNLQADSGAKSIIKLHLDYVNFIDFPEGKIDIDTGMDLRYLE
ncbi:MAG: nucleotidyltransferase family protein [Cyclobacteriaceae bacterium]|nr:nucleotidyltransferase family protein [Cyclobacteriaceae bacterium]